jgi:hypothetical protein
MLVDGGGKVMKFAPTMEGTQKAGFSASLVVPLGILALFCATATHVRLGQPFYFPVVFGILTWLALTLRDTRLRALIPLRS